MDKPISGYARYDPEARRRSMVNLLPGGYPPLPPGPYDILCADPPWDYGGKMQYDRSCIKAENEGFEKDIFLSAASFQYPTVKLRDLMALDVGSVAAADSLLFLWTTGPQLAYAVALGEAWGFQYKTVAFVWDKQAHNPGRYTLSQTEFVLAFKRGRFPTPRGARNVRQLISERRRGHSEKPAAVLEGITRMFPAQRKLELFARRGFPGWDSWGLEAPGQPPAVAQRGDLEETER